MQVIDAEMGRRRLLEDSPIASTNEDPVFFDTDQIPWWAWVRRFHLPEVNIPWHAPDVCHWDLHKKGVHVSNGWHRHHDSGENILIGAGV